MPTERRRVYFAGRVQGVGFRFTAQRLADALGVSGYVRNLSDGRVELVVEKDPATLDALIQSIRSELGDKIYSATATTEPVGDRPFPDFSIQY